MQQICGLSLYSPRGQCILILLAACKELGGSPTKGECLDFITEHRWFNKNLGQDLKPYPKGGTNEPRWKTLFAWARNDAAEHNCIERGDHGYWPITQQGKEEFARQKVFVCAQKIRLCLLFLAGPTFKSYLSPGYEVCELDLARPTSIYEDDGRYVSHNIQRLFLASL